MMPFQVSSDRLAFFYDEPSAHTPVTILRQLRNIGELGSGQSQRRARV